MMEHSKDISPGSMPCCLLDAALHTHTAGPPTATGSAGLHCTPDEGDREKKLQVIFLCFLTASFPFS